MYTYSDPNIYIKPKTTNVAGCTRNSLNVVASDKGVVVGRVKFLEDGVYTYPPLLLFPFCNAYLLFSKPNDVVATSFCPLCSLFLACPHALVWYPLVPLRRLLRPMLSTRWISVN